MSSNHRWMIVAFLALSLSARPLLVRAAEALTGEQYYQAGVRLYQMGRLSDAFKMFQRALEHHTNDREVQAYLERIRKEILGNARAVLEGKPFPGRSSVVGAPELPFTLTPVIPGQHGPARPLSQSALEPLSLDFTPSPKGPAGLRGAKVDLGQLFEPHSTTLKPGAMRVLERLASLVRASRDPIELSLVEEPTMALPPDKTLTSQRTLLILSFLKL
ncbi:MAG: hypothetical protein HYZ73_00930 [Elusimicrobia bacterium]|nr:hypothetical protein [Elusimicrobiota bacterium]